MNPDRLVLGLCLPWDMPSLDGDHRYSADDFAAFLDLAPALPVRWEHGPSIYGRTAHLDLGHARRFSALPACTDRPGGLLTLAELDDTPWCDTLLRALESGDVPGMSLALSVVREATVSLAWPTEVSLTRTPAFESARVLGVGDVAVTRWKLLTGQHYWASAE